MTNIENTPLSPEPTQTALDSERSKIVSRFAAGAAVVSLAGSFGATVFENLDSSPTIPVAVEHLVEEGIDKITGSDAVDTDVKFGMEFPGTFGFPDFSLKTEQTLADSSSNGNSISTGGRVIGPGSEELVRGKSTITRESVPDTIEQVTTLSEEEQKVAMEWARLFSEDSDADKLTSPQQIQAVVDKIVTLELSGHKIVSIDVTGHASDEDDTPDTDPELGPGLGIDSPKNVELATLRGAVVTGLLQDELNGYSLSTGSELPPVVNRQGVEVQDPAEQQALETYALKLGMDGSDLSELVKAYNRSEQVPEDARPLLDAIAEDRYVMVKITSSKTELVAVQHPDIITTSAGDKSYQATRGNTSEFEGELSTESEHEVESNEEGEIDLTLLLIALPTGLGLLELKRRQLDPAKTEGIVKPAVITGEPPLPPQPPQPPPTPREQPRIYEKRSKAVESGNSRQGHYRKPEIIKQPNQGNRHSNQKGGRRQSAHRSGRNKISR